MPRTKAATSTLSAPTKSKRALEEVTNPPAKRSRLSDEQLDQLDKIELIAKVKELEDELENLPARQDAASSGFSSNAPASIPPQELQTKADKARVLMVKGIKSQMKWKPSCKIGNAKFSYSGALPSTQVFAALTRQDADEKKVKKNLLFTSEEFGDKIAKTDIQTSVRYDYLMITSKNVSLRWKEEDLTFTVSGSYGKSMRE